MMSLLDSLAQKRDSTAAVERAIESVIYGNVNLVLSDSAISNLLDFYRMIKEERLEQSVSVAEMYMRSSPDERRQFVETYYDSFSKNRKTNRS